MTSHDSSYHNLFSHPEMLADLCKNFVTVPIYDMLDFSKATRVDTKNFSERNSKRESDLIYKIPHKDNTGDSYVCLFLEFQSQPDWTMSLRMMVYIGLFYQSLLKQDKNIKRLPAVFPIVLYNGKQPWKAPTSLRDCSILDTKSILWEWQPSLKFFLIDEQHYPKEMLQNDKNATSFLFQLESSENAEQAISLVSQAILPWMTSSENKMEEDVKRAFSYWVLQYFSATLGGPFPTFEQIAHMPFLEVKTMLSENIPKWREELRQEGRQEGTREGVQILAEAIEEILERQFNFPTKAFHAELVSHELTTLRTLLSVALRAQSLEEFKSAMRRIEKTGPA